MTSTFRTFTAAALIAAGALAAAPAHAGRVIWSVGIGAPGVAIGASNYGWSTGYYAPAPVYYAPAPVYYAPPPVYYRPVTPFYFGATYHSRPRHHHRHWAPPRHPGARPIHHGRPPHRHR